MKSFVAAIALCTITFFGNTQIATVIDSDGWVNVRELPNSTSDIIHQINVGKVFWYEDFENEWVIVHIPKNDFSLGTSAMNNLIGYIHSSRILPLHNMDTCSNQNFQFSYDIEPFDSTNRVIDYYEGHFVSKIDDRPVWGTDGDLPSTQVDDVIIKIDNKKVPIHKVLFSDIFHCKNEFRTYEFNDNYYVYQWNSDGAGFYEVVWVVNLNGVSQRMVGNML